MESSISQEDVSRFIRGTDTLWDAVYQNGFYISSKKSTMSTREFLLEIYNGTVIVPRSHEIKLHNVPFPPTIDQLISFIQDIIQNNNYPNQEQKAKWMRLLFYLQKYKPDKNYLLGLLGYLAPQHFVFEKTYRPPAKNNQQSSFVKPLIVNRDGFFNGLSQLSSKQLKKNASVQFLSKKERLSLELTKIEERRIQLEMQKAKKMEQLQEADNEPITQKFSVSREEFNLLQQVKAEQQQAQDQVRRISNFAPITPQQPQISAFEEEQENEVGEDQQVQEMTMNQLEEFQLESNSQNEQPDQEEENQEMSEQPYPYKRMVGRTPRRAAAAKFSELLKSSSKRR